MAKDMTMNKMAGGVVLSLGLPGCLATWDPGDNQKTSVLGLGGVWLAQAKRCWKSQRLL